MAVQTAMVEGNWNLAQHLELTPTSGTDGVTQAEMRAAQRTQLGQMRLRQRGKRGEEQKRRVTPRDSAREEESIAFSPQAMPKSSCNSVACSQSRPQVSLISPVRDQLLGHLFLVGRWHSEVQMQKYPRTRESASEKVRSGKHLEIGHHMGDRNKSQRGANLRR